MKTHSHRRRPQCTTAVTHLPQAATLAHVSPVSVHTHTRFHICSTARARFPEEHSQSASSSTRTKLSSHKLHFHSSHGTGTEGAHVGQTTRDRSPAPYPEALPDVPSYGHMQHNAQATRQHTGINSASPSPTAAQGSDYTGVQPPPGPGLLGAQHSSAIESKPSSLTRD